MKNLHHSFVCIVLLLLCVQTKAQTGMGIGTTNPVEKLEVTGGVKIGTTTNTNDGTIRWTGTDFEGRKSGAWVSLTATSGLTGSGTANYISKWTSASALGNSLLFDNGTNVGLGTSNPNYTLDIVSTLDNFQQLRVKSPGSPLIKWSGSYNSGNGAEFWQDASGNVRLNINGTTNFMYASASGANNIGIGTLNPQAKLHVEGQVKITGGTPGANQVLTSDAVGLATWEPIPDDGDWVISGNDQYSGVSGNVGIGSTTPRAKLQVFDGSSSATQTNFTQSLDNAGILVSSIYTNGSYTPGLFWSSQTDNNTKPKAGIYMYQSSAGSKLYLATSNSFPTGITNDGLVINETGNVGLGTTVPSAKLDVVGSIQYTDGNQGVDKVLRSDASGNATWVSVSALPIVESDPEVGSNTTNYLSKWNGSALVTGTLFDNGTSIGLGTASPQGRLHIHSAGANEMLDISGGGLDGSTFERFSLYVDNTFGMLFEAPAPGNLAANRYDYKFSWRGGGSALFIKGSTGNVGIGTTNPSTAKLQVNGDVKASNGFTVGAANSGVRIEYGIINVTASQNYGVTFSQAFTSPPVVTFGTVYNSPETESFATMTSAPTVNGFSVRLVEHNADWSRGQVHWMAIGQ